jgi:hypothetical protein
MLNLHVTFSGQRRVNAAEQQPRFKILMRHSRCQTTPADALRALEGRHGLYHDLRRASLCGVA